MDNGINITPSPAESGGFDLDITCSYCGQPITHSNEFGMYCDNECGRAEDEKACIELHQFFDKFEGLLGE
jgi:hypothetical protein